MKVRHKGSDRGSKQAMPDNYVRYARRAYQYCAGDQSSDADGSPIGNAPESLRQELRYRLLRRIVKDQKVLGEGVGLRRRGE